jgi:hypothetical protein
VTLFLQYLFSLSIVLHYRSASYGKVSAADFEKFKAQMVQKKEQMLKVLKKRYFLEYTREIDIF